MGKEQASNKRNEEMIFGRHPVVEALEEGQSLDKVFFQLGVRGELEKEVRKLCTSRKIPLQYVPIQKLNKLCRFNHQGIIALKPAIVYQSIADIIPHTYEQGQVPMVVILDGITDVRNLGAIARSAEVLGAHAIVIPQKGGAWVNGIAVKASAGALHRIPVCRELDLHKTVLELQDYGLQIVASELGAKKINLRNRLQGAHRVDHGFGRRRGEQSTFENGKRSILYPATGQNRFFECIRGHRDHSL